MTSDTYNGWTNRETWAAHLWLTNDEAVYLEARDVMARLIDKANRPIHMTACERQNADRRQRFVAEGLSDLMDNLLDDYIVDDKTRRAMQADIGSLWRVNWREVAEHMMEGE